MAVEDMCSGGSVMAKSKSSTGSYSDVCIGGNENSDK